MLGLGIGTILASFQIGGMILELRERLYRSVRYRMARGPRCLRWRMQILSGPRDLLDLLFLMADKISVGVSVMFSLGSWCICLSIVLCSLEVWYFTGLVN